MGAMQIQMPAPTGEPVLLCPYCGVLVDVDGDGEAVHRAVGGFLRVNQVEAIQAALADSGSPDTRVDNLCPTCLVRLMADIA